LARHYASSDLFLFPSMSETFGNVVLEAMASGIATVAFDYAAPQRYLRHAHSGWRIPFGHSPDLHHGLMSRCMIASGRPGTHTLWRPPHDLVVRFF
jgi:glycosyltransferase involved in cell wall biosynthesis